MLTMNVNLGNMQKEILDYIHKTFIEGVDFKVSDHCSTCMSVLNHEILNDPVVKEYLERTSKNN